MKTGSKIYLHGWADSLITGNERIDKQRRHIVRLANKLGDYHGGSAEAGRRALFLMSKLLLLVTHHFRDEEAILEKNGCPWVEEHVSSHVYFIEKLSAMLLLEVNEALEQAIPFIHQWFALHLADDDMKCRSYLCLFPESIHMPANKRGSGGLGLA